jgi:hypothetical protein
MKNKSFILLLVPILFLVLTAVLTGIFYQTTGSHIEFETVRGEHATFQGTGLYKYDPAVVAREGIIWDVVDLILTVPLFAVAIILTWQNKLRGRLILGGILFYFFYKYLMYVTMLAFNNMFLVYVAIFALSAVAFAINLNSIDVSQLPLHFTKQFPRRILIGFVLTMGFTLIVLWLGRIIPMMDTGKLPSELAGMNTLQTQAFDLGMVVPLMISTGILLWRRSAWGYLLGSISLTFGFIMCITLPAWIVTPLIQDGQVNLIEASPFSILCLIGIILSALCLRNIREEQYV